MRKHKGKEKLNLKLPKDRWQFCREVRLPDHYMTPGKPHPHTGKPSEPREIKVAESISKAVLLDLAQYDWPGNDNYKGNAYISHGTGLPVRSVSKGISVLRSIGALDREPQGVKKTALSRLNWEVLEKLREPFRGDDGDAPGPDDADISDDLDDELEALKAEDVDDDVIADLGPRSPAPKAPGDTQADLVNLLLEFGPYRNIQAAVESVIKGMLKTNSAEDIKAAWASLETWRKMRGIRKANPGGYLRTMLQNAIDDKPEPEPEDDVYDWDNDGESPAYMEEMVGVVRSEGVENIDLKGYDADMAQSFSGWVKRWLSKNATEIEYEIDHAQGVIRLTDPLAASVS